MGDFNLDLFHYDQHLFTQQFMDSLFTHMFIPLINRPTRLTSHSATLIDNIFTNFSSQTTDNGIILNDLSDHLSVFAFSSTKTNSRKYETNCTRDYNKLNLSKFQTSLSQVDWTSVVVQQNPNDAFDAFAGEYQRHFENCFPLKSNKRNSVAKSKSPWITRGLLVSIRKKNNLYKKYLANPTPFRDSQYKQHKNKLNHVLRISKKSYYDKQFELAKNDLKKTWKLINEVTNLKSKKPLLSSLFKSNGATITDPTEIANGFCKYFTGIGLSLASKIQPTISTFNDFLGSSVEETIFLKPTTKCELREICMSFSNTKAPGHDNIPMHIIKNSIEFILDPLMHLLNISLEKGICPDKLKTDKIISF